MGRPSWATADQVEFLKSFLDDLPRAKKMPGGLTQLYADITQKFLEKWVPEPISVTDERLSLEVLEQRATERARNRIIEWYKQYKKKAKKATESVPGAPPGPRSKTCLLDLSGKSRRKNRPYQLYQAFSILYWRPPESPLRRELEELWKKRHEDGVGQLLDPFLKDTAGSSTSRSEKLAFHMAFMRWKVSILTPEELGTLQSWIEEQHKSKEQVRVVPWSQEAKEYGDSLFAENEHIQSSIDSLVLTIQTAIEEIERQTGFKAMVFLGGLEPKSGKISSYLYRTGRSVETGKTFPEAYPEVNQLRTLCFNEWLRTTYTNEEKVKRCPPTTPPVFPTLLPTDSAHAQPGVSATTETPPTAATTESPDDPMAVDAATAETSPNVIAIQHPDEATAVDAAPITPSPSPCTGPPEGSRESTPPPTANPPPDLDPGETPDIANEPAPTPDRLSSPAAESGALDPNGAVGSLLATAGKNIFDLNGVREGFIDKAVVDYWEAVPGGTSWIAMIKSYLALSQLAPAKGQLQRLSAKSRPQEFESWKTQKRSLEKIPIVLNASSYGSQWVKWWTECQLPPRNAQVWPPPRDVVSDIGWRKFPAHGPNGLFLAVMAISWWAHALKSAEDVLFFEEAIADLHWVIQELIRTRSDNGAPTQPPAALPLGAHALRCSEGKRVVKPSRKLRESLE